MNIRKPLIAIFVFAALLIPFSTWADEGSQNANHFIDCRLSLGFGPFMYPQYVDGGFYINNRPYDLTWYGWQIGLIGQIEYLVPSVKGLGVGLAGVYFTGLNPSGMDANNTVTRDANKNAPGGFGGGSVSYCLNDKWRMNIIAGYGGTGIPDYYGGYGPAVSVAFNYLFPHGNIVGGVGVRLILMSLSSPGTTDKRSEKGDYMAIMAETSIDWIP